MKVSHCVVLGVKIWVKCWSLSLTGLSFLFKYLPCNCTKFINEGISSLRPIVCVLYCIASFEVEA